MSWTHDVNECRPVKQGSPSAKFQLTLAVSEMSDRLFRSERLSKIFNTFSSFIWAFNSSSRQFTDTVSRQALLTAISLPRVLRSTRSIILYIKSSGRVSNIPEEMSGQYIGYNCTYFNTEQKLLMIVDVSKLTGRQSSSKLRNYECKTRWTSPGQSFSGYSQELELLIPLRMKPCHVKI